MHIAKYIFLILGILFIVFNAIAYLGGAHSFPIDTTVDTAGKIAYFIGSNFLFILGAVFLYFAKRYANKIKRRQDTNLVDSLLNDAGTTEEKK